MDLYIYTVDDDENDKNNIFVRWKGCVFIFFLKKKMIRKKKASLFTISLVSVFYKMTFYLLY